VICTETLKAHVSSDIKLRAKAIADREFLSEAAWLKRLVLREIRACDGAHVSNEREACGVDGINRRTTNKARATDGGCGRSILVSLRSEDRLLVDARAEARGMRPATYVSVLIRSHLRRLAPLPKDEFLVLKRSIGELASIGRNINQIAKAVNEGGRAPGSVREEFRAMLKICEALRDNTKALLKANEISWQTGESHADV
jgi:Bacterial mobilisation protein (MobC)